MSKRSSTGASNTLFNYFTKTPPANKKVKNVDVEVTSEEKKLYTKYENKRDRESIKRDNSSDDDSPKVNKKKRIRLYPVESDDSDTENKVVNKKDDSKATQLKSLHDSFKFEKREDSLTDSPKSSKKPSLLSTPSRSTQEKIEAPSVSDDGNWTHCKLDFLRPEKIRDAQKRRPDHPDYDPRTLFVPDDFMKKQTPAHRQWWEMKSSHYDCVLFFKVGKFYELYHMDAAVGVNELGFSYMKGEFAHSGFPESAYSRMASVLVAKGYKVARVEQTETPDMMAERCKTTGQNSKWDKVVRREICQVALKGAEVLSLQDSGPTAAQPLYMTAISEQVEGKETHYGVCTVDASIGVITIGQFSDDRHSTRLRTMLARYPPAILIFERRSTTPKTQQIINSYGGNVRKEAMNQMWPAEKTLKIMSEKYFAVGERDKWPAALKRFLDEDDRLCLTPARHGELALKALGGCISYLSGCLLDIQVMEMSKFHEYIPNDTCRPSKSESDGAKWDGPVTMVLDAITLKNLRIINVEGSLYDRLNFCVTNMGKRLLHEWVCTPSCMVDVINERQEAIQYLLDNYNVCQQIQDILKEIPDMDRLLAKIHTLGNLKRATQHPDSRAIFYEEKTYSKRKVQDFMSLVAGFESAQSLSDLLSESEAGLLKKLSSTEGQFPDYEKTLAFFKDAFDHKEAEKEGRMVPRPGVDQDYDQSLWNIKEIEEELDAYLKDQELYFGCRISYVGTDKKRFQLEVPEKEANRKATDEYQLEGSRKGFKRFTTSRSKELLSKMMSAEQQKTEVLLDLSRRIFEKFSSKYAIWSRAIACVANIDAILSLAEYARLQPTLCRPDVRYADKPFIKIREGRHPCIPLAEDFIPNDTELGGDQASFVLLSGANMGGKSTLMRQVGLLTIMAQIGSLVPAESCSMSVVRRVFTRVGARDDIASGSSTFLVEMAEAAAILDNADTTSLVLIDELGRGTSTYDGTAIAWGVLSALSEIGCPTIFSTHYHKLSEKAIEFPNIRLMHMACMVEQDEVPDDNSVSEECITFLYKLGDGSCPKSYGFNAARLAGLPTHIIRAAQGVATRMQKRAEYARACRDIYATDNIDRVREIIQKLDIRV